jgi:DMSO/TMAO reductase YedYZ heme-binding membrane subunit
MALPLIALAALGALFRRRLKNSWRLIHYANYVAFLLATTHAALFGGTFVGQTFRHTLLRVVVGLMAAAAVLVFAQKRRVAARRRRARG